MSTARPPVNARRLIPELLLTLLVLAGVYNCVSHFLIDGRLPQPFVFDANDTFMDWFNTAYWAHNPGAFDVWHTVYPPLSFVILRLTGISGCYGSDPFRARECDYIGIWAILTFYALCVSLAYLAFRRADRRTAIFRGVAFGLGFPLLFTLERGNLILPCLVCFILAYGDIARSRWVRALGIAATINFKPYLLVPAMGHAFRRNWRFLELAGFTTVIVYLGSYAVMGSGSPTQIIENTLAWITFTDTQAWEKIYYSTSFTPFLAFNTYRFPTHEYLPSKTIDPFFAAIPIIIGISRIAAIACMVGAWLQPKALPTARLALLLLTTSLIMQSPGGYTETFLIFLLFLERWERPGPIVALVMGYLLCVPYDYVLTVIVKQTGDSWLSGRSVATEMAIAAGVFIRPGLLVIMQWALAADSLTLIWRAHRHTRPTLAMGPVSRATPKPGAA